MIRGRFKGWGMFIETRDFYRKHIPHHTNEIDREDDGDGYMPKSQAHIEVTPENRGYFHLHRLAV